MSVHYRRQLLSLVQSADVRYVQRLLALFEWSLIQWFYASPVRCVRSEGIQQAHIFSVTACLCTTGCRISAHRYQVAPLQVSQWVPVVLKCHIQPERSGAAYSRIAWCGVTWVESMDTRRLQYHRHPLWSYQQWRMQDQDFFQGGLHTQNSVQSTGLTIWWPQLTQV